MATKYLLNTTRVGTTTHSAGSHFDDVLEAVTIAQLTAAGGKSDCVFFGNRCGFRTSTGPKGQR